MCSGEEYWEPPFSILWQTLRIRGEGSRTSSGGLQKGTDNRSCRLPKAALGKNLKYNSKGSFIHRIVRGVANWYDHLGQFGRTVPPSPLTPL